MEDRNMRVSCGTALAVALGLSLAAARADELKSGPDKKNGGPFQVKAITGENKGTQLCYV
jgi:hypothetical protein